MAAEVMWRALRWPGTERVVLAQGPHESRAHSVALVVLGGRAYQISYELVCGSDGGARHFAAEVSGLSFQRRVELTSDGDGRWRNGDGRRLVELDGCLDIDLSVTPLTNTPAIVRLGLVAGAKRDLMAAYVEAPDLSCRAASQSYECLRRDEGGGTYRYRSGSFQADLAVGADNLVMNYPGLWRRVPLRPTAADETS
jgi:uncharacterized protein